MIPDIKLHEILIACVDTIRADYELYKATPSDTILGQLINDTVQKDTGKYKWLDQATEIFINRDENHPKFLETRLFFDRERADIPTIHVMMSGENKGQDGIGFDSGFN